MVQDIPIEAITIGPRFRKDLGDIVPLAESIAQIGLLHPILVTTGYALIAGRRRLAAHEHLGRARIPADVIDLEDLLEAEIDENEQRKDYTPSEKATIGVALEAHIAGKAKERQREAGKKHGRGTIASADSAEAIEIRPTTRDIVTKRVRMSHDSYDKAKAVLKAAEEEPDLQEFVEQMDRTGNVTRAYNQLPHYARAHPDDDDLPRARKPPRPMALSTMQVKLDAVVLDIIAPRLSQLADHEVEHLRKLLRFYLDVLDKERPIRDTTPQPSCPPVPQIHTESVTDTESLVEDVPPAPEEEPAPMPPARLCLWCGGKFRTEEDEIRHRAQCGGYLHTPTPAAPPSPEGQTGRTRKERKGTTDKRRGDVPAAAEASLKAIEARVNARLKQLGPVRVRRPR